MVTPQKSIEAWQVVLELRTRQEVIERWLASQSLSAGLEQSLRSMLREVKDQLRLITNALYR